MYKVKEWTVRTMEAETVHGLIRRIVPYDSPLSAQVHRFVFELIKLSPRYLMRTNDQSTDSSLTKLTHDECNTIIKVVNFHKSSDIWSVPYMLAAFTDYYRQKPLTDKSWLFISKYLQFILLIVEREDKHFNKINNLGVRIRMALKKNSSQTAIIDELINIHGSSANVYENFADIESYEQGMRHREQTGLVKNTNIAKKVGEIRLAYEVVLEDKVYIERKFRGKGQSVFINKTRNEQALPFTNEITRRIRFPKLSSDNNVAKPEDLADDNPLALLDNKYNPSKKTAKSSQLQQYQVKTSYLHNKRNQFMFPSNTRLLTVFDYQSVFVKLWSIVSDEEQRVRRVAAILLLSMITGRSIQNVIKEVATNKSQRKFLVEEDNGVTVIRNTINVTVNQRDQIKPITKSHSNNFSLPLPLPLSVILPYKFEVEPTEITQLLKTLRESLSLPLLSNQHIESALAFIITHRIGEPLHSDIITGVEVEHSSPLYYTSIKTSSLFDTYQAAIKILSNRCFESLKSTNFYRINRAQKLLESLNPKNYKLWQAHRYPYFVDMPIVASNINKTYIGSEMALTDQVCSNFFALLAEHVHADKRLLSHGTNANEDEYIKQFNAYGLWLWHVIQIQTGIRPVNDAPGFLNQFNFSHDMYWVSDKSIRQGKDHGRLIPTSNFLKTALKNYINYIKHFASVHNPLYSDHRLNINKILQSEEPFLQIFSLNPKKFMPITPKRIRNTVGKALPHQDNWLRHQLRSMLTNELDEVYVCALLGHEHADQEIFHPMSSLSINQYRTELLPQLDHVVQKLDLKQVEIKRHG
jgi:hypothetical protein